MHFWKIFVKKYWTQQLSDNGSREGDSCKDEGGIINLTLFQRLQYILFWIELSSSFMIKW